MFVTFVCAKVWDYSPKTMKIRNFAHKFAHGENHLHDVHEILSIGSFYVFNLVTFG